MGWELDEAYEGVKRLYHKKKWFLGFFWYGGFDFDFCRRGQGVELSRQFPPLYIYEPRLLCRMRPGATAHRAFHHREISVV